MWVRLGVGVEVGRCETGSVGRLGVDVSILKVLDDELVGSGPPGIRVTPDEKVTGIRRDGGDGAGWCGKESEIAVWKWFEYAGFVRILTGRKVN